MKRLRHAIEMDLGELAGLARRRWRALLVAAGAAALAGFLGSFLVTPRYHAYVSILPRRGILREQQVAVAQGELTAPVRLRPTTASNTQNMVRAASYRLRAELVDSLDLVAFFDLADLAAERPDLARHRAVDALRRATHLELSIYRDVLFIHLMTRDAAMSARLANAYLDALQRENLREYRREAESRASFLQTQLAAVRVRIEEALAALVVFQGEREIVDLESQRRGLLSLLEQIHHEWLAASIALERERLDLDADAPAVARLEALVALYREAITLLDGASAEGAPPFGSSVMDPGTALAAERLRDRLRGLQAVEQSLLMELSAAVMEAGLDELQLPVMDRAVAPAEPDWPDRALITVGAGLLVPLLLFLLFVLRAAARSRAAGEAAA
ncbi:MAG: hypothetical protein JW819_10665 [Candidatus Krumholzibacteriota bacterium]|nr:hypothetical protein [Candidatus Krumholzibacteriota bacterium]